MNIREEVKKCKVCKSEGATLVCSHILNGYTESRGIKCTACDTIHYYEEGKLTYRFYPTRASGEGLTF